METTKVSLCKFCGREIPYSGHGGPRMICDVCRPGVEASKIARHRILYRERGYFKRWYQNNKEIIVAVTCVFCGDIVIGRSGKMLCRDCMLKWQRKIPQRVVDELASRSTVNLSQEMVTWKRMMDYRNRVGHILQMEGGFH